MVGYNPVAPVVPPSQANFVFAYDTTTQSISLTNTFQTLTYDTNGQLDGWAHTTGTGVFTCNQTGLYLVTFDLQVNKIGGGAGNFAARATFNAVEVAGSHTGIDYATNNLHMQVSRTFLVSATAAQVLEIEMAGDQTGFEVSPDTQNPGTATTRISCAIDITRIQ